MCVCVLGGEGQQTRACMLVSSSFSSSAGTGGGACSVCTEVFVKGIIGFTQCAHGALARSAAVDPGGWEGAYERVGRVRDGGW